MIDTRPRMVRFLTSWATIALVVLLGFIGILLMPDQPVPLRPVLVLLSLACFVIALLLCPAYLVLGFIYGFEPTEKDDHCRKCGYNLTGNVSGRCPECGTPVPGAGQPIE